MGAEAVGTSVGTSRRVGSDATSIFPRLLDLDYPNVERGQGVWLFTTDGRRILDACSGGAMVACLGHGETRVIEAAAAQAERIAYMYNHHFTNEAQERLADRVTELTGLDRARFVSGGSEANEMALRLARSYHVERGDGDRWRMVSVAQSYHGSTMATLALTGRRRLQEPYHPYLSEHAHIPLPRSDPTGEAALRELDRVLEEVGPETVAAFFCEPVGGAALPAFSPPDGFWHGLAERRERHGFLICFDEVVTGMGRVGTWLAAHRVPIDPDIVTIGKALGAGYAPLAAALCRDHVYEAIDRGSGQMDLGHTWDGAPLPCSVGLAVLDVLLQEGLVERVRSRGPGLRQELQAAVGGSDIVRDVRGRGFLMGVELVDPGDGESFLPDELDAADMVDRVAFDHGLLVTSTHSTADGYTGDNVLLAPAYTSTDGELAEMVGRFQGTIAEVESRVKRALAGASRRPVR